MKISQFSVKFLSNSLICLLLVTGLTVCGGGDDGGDGPAPITSLELLDPTPGAGDIFGGSVVSLANGNIVVTEQYDSSVAENNGAVHLYNPNTQTLIASIYGDSLGDRIGSSGITVLANDNFIISSPLDDEGGIVDAGSIRLVDGVTGIQIGATLTGDVAGDRLGYEGVITLLANNNFVVASSEDNTIGILDTGFVQLMDGNTGMPIGASLVGDVAFDRLGGHGITVLANNNFVISSPSDNEAGIVDAGSVRLMDGISGVQIGATLAGDVAGDGLGGIGGVTALANNNFVVSSSSDNEAGIVGAGSIRLMDGDTGEQIGATLVGDVVWDQLGWGGITALANSNFVVSSPHDNVAGIVDAGSVQLMDGSTGEQIGATLAGDVEGDQLSGPANIGITALANNNFVVSSPIDDEAGIVDAGSIRLMDGTIGEQIGTTLAGDVEGDGLGYGGTTALPNNNFVVVSLDDDEAGIVNAGSVRLMNGTTGEQIGTTLVGEVAENKLGTYGSITVLANNNFVVSSPYDDVAGIVDAGTVRLMDGSTGEQLGNTLVGDADNDTLGLNGSITVLANNNFVVSSPIDDEGGIEDAGSVRLFNGSTGAQIGALVGDSRDDRFGQGGITPLAGNNFVIISPLDDEGGIFGAGSARLVDGFTGMQIGNAVYGRRPLDMLEANVTATTSGKFYILGLPYMDNFMFLSAGRVFLVDL